MKILKLRLKAKDNVANCLKVINATQYQDTIIKYITYTNFTSHSLKVANICETPLVLPMQPIFSQVDNLGSTFVASIDNTPIPAGQTVNVPVYYNGKYRGVETDPLYNFNLNGMPVVYQLHVVNNDNIGIIENFMITKENQEDHTFSAVDFLNHFTDIDGDSIATVMFYINVSRLRYNGVAYIEGEEIPLSDIQAGKLKYIAPLVESEDLMDLTYNVRDTNNNIVN